MNGSTLKSILDATLHADRVERAAHRAALVQRRGGSVQPTELVHAVCLASAVGATRSIAEARRQWELLSGRCISRSAFDAHFDKPALVETLWDLLRSAMAHANRALRRQWPAPLRMLDDVLLDDGSRMRLRKSAAEKFPATDEGTAGLKLMTRMSLAEGSLCDATVDAARTHDHALRFRTAVQARGALLARPRLLRSQRICSVRGGLCVVREPVEGRRDTRWCKGTPRASCCPRRSRKGSRSNEATSSVARATSTRRCDWTAAKPSRCGWCAFVWCWSTSAAQRPASWTAGT
jgi:hypothetical protein